MKATSSAPEEIVAQAGTGAESGSYTLSVSQLATAQSLATDAFADADVALGVGVLRLTIDTTSVDIEVGTEVDLVARRA